MAVGSLVHADVCIVGGGPGGLALAKGISAVRPNARVLVMERRSMAPTGATVSLMPNGLNALAAIDPSLKPAMIKRGVEQDTIHMYSRAGELLRVTTGDALYGGLRDAGGDMVHLGWQDMRDVIAATLAPGVLRPERRFERYEQRAPLGDQHAWEPLRPGAVRAHFEDCAGGRVTVAARLLVGADGAQSAVRRQLLGDGAPRFTGTAVWRAVMPRPANWVVPSGSARWGDAGSNAGVLTYTLGGGRLSWQIVAPWPAERLAEIGGAGQSYVQGVAAGAGPGADARRKQRQQRILDALEAGGFPAIVKDMVASADPAAITEHGQFYRAPRDCSTYHRGNVALIGDAAHMSTPALGQATSQAYEDALELSRAIGEEGFTAAALQRYHAVCHPRNALIHSTSVRLYEDFASGRNPDIHQLVGRARRLNVELGFVGRTFEPLVARPAVKAGAARPAAAPAASPALARR